MQTSYQGLISLHCFLWTPSKQSPDVQESPGLDRVLKKSKDVSMLINIQAQDIWRNNVLFLIPTVVSVCPAVRGSEHPVAQIPSLTCNCFAAWPLFVIAPHSPDCCHPPVLGKALNLSEVQSWPLQKKLLQSLSRRARWKLETSCFCSLTGARRSSNGRRNSVWSP